MRIDGMLTARHAITLKLLRKLIARIKMLARLDIAQSHLPQEGRMQVSIKSTIHDIRISCIPTQLGERVVLRMLARTHLPTISALGMNTKDQNNLIALAKKPAGLIVIAGPTGSGKTTTLYSLLNAILDEDRNIMTIEDPVEYLIPGISQTQTNAALQLSFAAGLKALLRQDPDVILIGEIRDAETAQIAVAASMTGHLVLSTIHAKSLRETIHRLIALKVSPILLTSSIVALGEQRLVRSICPNCHYTQRNGCTHCNKSGYRGRTGIYHFATLTDHDRALLYNFNHSTQSTLFSWEQSTTSLQHKALNMVAQGTTNQAEIERVLSTSL